MNEEYFDPMTLKAGDISIMTDKVRVKEELIA